MNLERTKYLGRREELKNRANRLKYSIDGIRSTIRDILDPMARIEEIDAPMLFEQAYELTEKIQQYKEIRLNIRKLNRELGEGTDTIGGMGLHG